MTRYANERPCIRRRRHMDVQRNLAYVFRSDMLDFDNPLTRLRRSALQLCNADRAAPILKLPWITTKLR